MNKTIKNLIILISITIALILVGWWIINPNSPGDKNPYEYDIKGLLKTDNSLICNYNELSFPVPLTYPVGIAYHSNNSIFVTGDSSLLNYNLQGELLSRFNLLKPLGSITSGPYGKLYIAVENHIEVYNENGICENKWNVVKQNCVITSIAAGKNDVYAADAENHRIYKFDMNGKLLQKIGGEDSADSVLKFIIPSYYFDLAFDSEGFLWVVNPGRHWIIKLDDSGKIIRFWGKTAMTADGFCGCCNPSHFTISPDGSFITTEKSIPRIKKYDSDGNLTCVLAGSEKFNEISKGMDVAIDSKQNIYVLEPYEQKVHIFMNK